MYANGFRKFVLAGVGPLGCIPDQLAARAALPGECVTAVNDMAELFNDRLISLVDRLNSDNKTAGEAIFVYGNTYGATVDILTNPFAYGLVSNLSLVTILINCFVLAWFRSLF